MDPRLERIESRDRGARNENTLRPAGAISGYRNTAFRNPARRRQSAVAGFSLDELRTLSGAIQFATTHADSAPGRKACRYQAEAPAVRLRYRFIQRRRAPWMSGLSRALSPAQRKCHLRLILVGVWPCSTARRKRRASPEELTGIRASPRFAANHFRAAVGARGCRINSGIGFFAFRL